MSTMTMHPPIHAPLHVPDYKLTRRGRLVVLVLGLALLVAMSVAFSGGSAATSDREIRPTSKVVAVAPGITLWDLASDVTGGSDVREMMTRIEEMNGLATTVLDAGQRVRVPLG